MSTHVHSLPPEVRRALKPARELKAPCDLHMDDFRIWVIVSDTDKQVKERS